MSGPIPTVAYRYDDPLGYKEFGFEYYGGSHVFMGNDMSDEHPIPISEVPKIIKALQRCVKRKR
jgi:hypothetical protein